MTSPGLDLITHLNFVSPREFLLQAEDELEAFARAVGEQRTTGVEDTRQQLVFPPLGRPYDDLLVAIAQRYGFATTASEDSSRHRKLAVWTSASLEDAPTLPQLCFADFLRIQRQKSGGAPLVSAVAGAGQALQRLRLRSWAVDIVRDADKKHTTHDTVLDDESALQGGIDGYFATKANKVDCNGPSHFAESSGSTGSTKKRRGRGFEIDHADHSTLEESRALKHCYERFGPHRKRRIYLRDNIAQAPWPTVKLFRDLACPITWRPEWRVGPDDGDAEAGARGGILSWAVEPRQFSFGEGYEVSLRCGPGPSCTTSVGGTANDHDDIPERADDDFVLSFRRGEREWHFTAGSRNTSNCQRQKTLPDPLESNGQRQMFWVACLESCADGKHYVIVGVVPGLLVEHFFVAKVGRSECLSHAGFNYLPLPGEAAFGTRSDKTGNKAAILVESVTVFPHSLTGELPFVSLRFVEEHLGQKEPDSSMALASASILRNDEEPRPKLTSETHKEEELQTAQIKNELASEEAKVDLQKWLVVRRTPLSKIEADPERLASWSQASRRECGLPQLGESAAERAERLERRARRRVRVPTTGVNELPARMSWEPDQL